LQESPIARRYAKALVELCSEVKNHAVIGKQLEGFTETWINSQELQDVLKSPVIDSAAKKQILGKLFAKNLFAPTTRNFLLVLLDAGRIELIPEINLAFGRMMDALNQRVRATVTSAVPMERSDLVRIQSALQRLTGKTVVLDARVDPSLLGGVVTEIGNVVLDGSIMTQLKSLRERLLA